MELLMAVFLAGILRIVCIVVAFYCIPTAILSLIAGHWLQLFFCILVLFVFLGLAGWAEGRSTDKLEKIIASRGIKADFLSHLDGQGVVIDLANKKLLVGHLDRTLILEFSNVTQIISEDVPRGKNSAVYDLKVRTNNFNAPLLSARFSRQAQRDEAYSKLHTALGC
jgi:hypothetical protein